MAGDTFTPSPTNCLLGRGEALFKRRTTAGVGYEFLSLGNVSELSVTGNDTNVELANFLTADGGNYAEALDQRDISGTLTLHELNADNIALLTAGNVTYYTQAATPVVAESLSTAAVLGATYQTAKRQITSVVVKQGATTLVLGTDYTIPDANPGLIKLLSTGGATAGAALTVDYTPTVLATTAQKTVSMFTEGTIYGTMLFNPATGITGPRWEGKWFNVAMKASALNGLIGSTFAASPISFKVLNDAAGTYGGSTSSPYGTLYRRT